MELLNTNRYNIVIDRLKEIPFNTLFANSVLTNAVKGKVFVNNIESPGSFLVCHPYGMSLLFGDVNNELFNDDLTKYFLNKDNHRTKTEWLQVFPNDWNNKIYELSNNNIIDYNNISNGKIEDINNYISENRKGRLIQWNRINFFYNNKPISIEIKDDNLELHPVNKDNISLIYGSVVPKAFWNSETDFLQNGIGFILLNKGDFVSVAFSAFRDNEKLEIGVETSDKYRKKGMARIVCNALLNYCIDNNLEPIWSCKKENTGSYNLALSLGFIEKYTLPYYELVI